MLAEAEAAEEAARIKAEVAMTEANKQRASLQMAMHDAQVRAAAAAAAAIEAAGETMGTPAAPSTIEYDSNHNAVDTKRPSSSANAGTSVSATEAAKAMMEVVKEAGGVEELEPADGVEIVDISYGAVTLGMRQ